MNINLIFQLIRDYKLKRGLENSYVKYYTQNIKDAVEALDTGKLVGRSFPHDYIANGGTL